MRIEKKMRYYGTYVCDAKIPGKNCPAVAAHNMNITSMGIGNRLLNNFQIGNMFPSDRSTKLESLGLTLAFSDEELRERARGSMTLTVCLDDRPQAIVPAADFSYVGITEEGKPYEVFSFNLPEVIPVLPRQPIYVEALLDDWLTEQLQRAEAALRFREPVQMSLAEIKKYGDWLALIRVTMLCEVSRERY